ncbi:hypothetical protein BZB76_2503 [Actinomadura pelletieri DSM 43383]|uniref:Uncharacterized protein n=1 Tax=Actinomadura pelletieri DSM 43383 TaxID=1120940 RepID=A0A495QUG0_9ACTN|nr:hypothetical protein [Actinomadura pelletieri]RKS77129.1 hypothetical protein BZB76_2503 [Actinomadura pelletieri DSM 43383]
MLAAYRAGLRTRALEIYKRSTGSAASHFDVPLRRSLHRLAELIRDEDPRLHGPDAPAALSAPAPAPSRGPSNVGKTMTEPPINQTARGKSRVTNMIGRVDGDVHIGAEPDPSENDDRPETEGRPERRDEA